MKSTYDLGDPGSDKIHLVHIGSQHIEVQREGGLGDGKNPMRTESPKAFRPTGGVPRPRPQLRLW